VATSWLPIRHKKGVIPCAKKREEAERRICSDSPNVEKFETNRLHDRRLTPERGLWDGRRIGYPVTLWPVLVGRFRHRQRPTLGRIGVQRQRRGPRHRLQPGPHRGLLRRLKVRGCAVPQGSSSLSAVAARQLPSLLGRRRAVSERATPPAASPRLRRPGTTNDLTSML
jgi:hypothetical protein